MGKDQSKPAKQRTYIIPPEEPIETETPSPLGTIAFPEIFAVGCQGTVYVCDSVEFTIKKKLKYEHSLKDFINPIAITENGEKLIIGFTTMYTLVVWNLKNDYKQFRQILLEDGYATKIKAFYESTVITVQNQTLNIWDLENGSLVKSFTFNSKIMGIDVIPNQKKCIVGLENGYMKAIDSDFKIIDLRRPLNGDFLVLAAQPSGKNICTIETLANWFGLWNGEMSYWYAFMSSLGTPKDIIFVNDAGFMVVFDDGIQYRLFPKAKVEKIFSIKGKLTSDFNRLADEFKFTSDLKCFAKKRTEIEIYQFQRTPKSIQIQEPGPNDILLNINTLTESFQVSIDKNLDISNLMLKIRKTKPSFDSQSIVLIYKETELSPFCSIKMYEIEDGAHLNMYLGTPEFDLFSITSTPYYFERNQP